MYLAVSDHYSKVTTAKTEVPCPQAETAELSSRNYLGLLRLILLVFNKRLFKVGVIFFSIFAFFFVHLIKKGTALF